MSTTSLRTLVTRLSLGTILAAAVLGPTLMGCPEGSRAGNPGNAATPNTDLTAAEVEQIILRAISEAQAQNVPMAVAVTDREGEVLGVFTTGPRDRNGDGIQEVVGEGQIQTAISQALTAAAFQSEGDAFTTRTAFFIVQGNFPPGVDQTAGGPLFGVQDSSQPNSDGHIIGFDQNGTAVGTGITGVLGGIPLFKQGTPVGGVGVATVAAVQTLTVNNLGSDATPSPTLVTPLQDEVAETIARAAAGPQFEAPPQIQATNVFVDGIGFPFVSLGSPPPPGTTIAATISALPANAGLIDPRFPVRASPLIAETAQGNFFGIRTNQRFLGRIVAPRGAAAFTNVDRPATVVLSTASLTFQGVPIQTMATRNSPGGPLEIRYPAIDGVDPSPVQGGLTAAEVNQILDQAAASANRSVAGIRLPRGKSVVVHISVVDRRGNILGLARMADGTLFSSDVAVQKARTAAFFSTDGTEGLPPCAITPRAIGFLAQPFFPPGIPATEPGPLVRLRDLVNRGKVTIEIPPSFTTINPPARPPSDGTTDENPLAGGFQRFNDYAGVASPTSLQFIRGIIAARGGLALFQDRPDTTPPFVSPGLQNGIQTFPGGVPLYKGNILVGALGISGDGVDEDDQAAFEGAANFQPPPGIRCDEVAEPVVVQVLTQRLNDLANAIANHPDPAIQAVYGPIMSNERNFGVGRMGRGLQGIRIPYVKLPRNPGKS